MPTQTLFTMVVFYSMVAFVPVTLALLYKWPRLWHLLLALYLGLIAGLSDLRTDDPQLVIVLLTTFGLFLGYSEPNGAWRWALALAAWVPGLGLASASLGLRALSWPNLLLSSVVLIPALVGVYAGALVRRLSPRHASTA